MVNRTRGPLAASDSEIRPTPGQRAAFIREALAGVDIVHVYGEADISNAKDFEAAIFAPRLANKSLIVDLTACVYVDSSGLGVLMRAKKMLGSLLRIVVPEGHVARVFEISGLKSLLN